MSDLNWGVPSQRKTKVEKFDTPVLTMTKLEGKGTGRKFTFNKAAIEALGIDSETDQTAMIGFGEDKSIFVKVVNGEDVKGGYRLTKTGTFSNKRVFEYITDLRELSNDVENELHLGDSEVAEAMEVTSITNENSDKISNEDAETLIEEAESMNEETVSEESEANQEKNASEDSAILDETTDKIEKTTEEVEEEEW